MDWTIEHKSYTQDQNPNYQTFEKPDSSLYICRRQLERTGHILRPIITCTISRNIMIFRRRPSHRKIMWSFGDDFPQWVKKNKKSGIYDDVICPAIKGKEIQNVISLSSLFPKNAFFFVFFWHIVNLAPFVEWWSKSTFFFKNKCLFYTLHSTLWQNGKKCTVISLSKTYFEKYKKGVHQSCSSSILLLQNVQNFTFLPQKCKLWPSFYYLLLTRNCIHCIMISREVFVY